VVGGSDLQDESEVHKYVTVHFEHVVREVIGCYTLMMFKN